MSGGEAVAASGPTCTEQNKAALGIAALWGPAVGHGLGCLGGKWLFQGHQPRGKML